MDYTVHGMWVSKESSQPRDRTQVSRIAGGFLPAEPQGKPIKAICKELVAYKEFTEDLSLVGLKTASELFSVLLCFKDNTFISAQCFIV